MSTLRKDPITQGWVIFAEERYQRPPEMPVPRSYPAPEHCPFCPGNEEMTPAELLAVRPAGSRPNTPGWSVRAIPNQFALLRIEGKFDRRGEGLYDMMNGIGAHEVIIETPDHEATLAGYGMIKIQEVLWTCRERAIDLQRDPRFRYIQIFRNYGEAAGASITHPHSQIIALPILPRRLNDEVSQSFEYWTRKERCVFCDIVNQDSEGPRLVYENDYFVALEPFASKFPFETWILPKEHSAYFHHISDTQLPSLAETLRVTLAAFAEALSYPPYNLIIHMAPLQPDKKYLAPRSKIYDFYHWHIEIVPRIGRVAGFEFGTGFYINSVLPEDAAEYLRNVIEERRDFIVSRDTT
jgi:UDPglucose--hexose-1-phosphate uridylyltransferase